MTTIQTLIQSFGALVNMLGPIVAALALLLFFWGLVRFIFNSKDGADMNEAKGAMFWGVIALFVLFSVFGLIRVLQGTFGLTPGMTNSIEPPMVGNGGPGNTVIPR